MSLTPTQLLELQTIVLDLGEEFPHNADALWNAAIRIQVGGLGPTSGAGGQPAFDAAVADIKVCQEEVQTYQQRQGSPSSGFDVAVLQVVPSTSTFPSGNVGEILYLETAPNSYIATDQIVITPLGPNSVQMDEVGTTVFRTVPAASGGIEINNLATGIGFERVLTTADLTVMGGQVDSVVGGINISVNAADPVNPIVNLDAAITGVSVNGVTLSAAGAATNYLAEDGSYSVPADQVVNGTADGQIPIWDQTTDTQYEPSVLLTIIESGSGGSARIDFDMESVTQFYVTNGDGGLFTHETNTVRMESRGGSLGSAQLAFFSSGASRALIYNTHANVLFFDQESSGLTHALFGYPVAVEAGMLPSVGVDGSQFFASLASTPMVRQQQNFSFPVANVTGACWRFNNPTAAADPGATFMRMNTADFATGTELYFDDLSVDNSQDMAWWFNTLAIGDTLWLQGVGEPDRWLQCTIDSIVDNTGWYTIVFTMIDNLGTNFLNGQDTQIQVQKAAAVTAPAGANTQIQFNNSGVFGASANLLWDGTDFDIVGAGGLVITNTAAAIAVRSDATDINFTHSGVTDWNITGITAINAGTVDLDVDVLTATSFNGVALTAAGAATNFLNEAGAYSVPPSSGVNNPMTVDLDGDGFNFDDMGVMFMREQATADADVSTQGQIWVRTDPFSNSLMFTNDNGNDFEVAALNLSDMNSAILLITGTSFVECLVFSPDVNQDYMLSASFEVNSPSADDMNIELVIDTNAVFKGVLTYSNQDGSVTGTFALDSGVGEVITNIVTVPTEGNVTPEGTYVTITGCIRMGATSGTHSVRAAKNADTGADGRFEATAALQVSIMNPLN